MLKHWFGSHCISESLLCIVTLVAIVTAPVLGQEERPSDRDTAAVPLEKGYLRMLPGTEWAAMVVTRKYGEDQGELYLWHRAEDFERFRGSFRHIPLEHPVTMRGMSWSPNGKALAFYQDVDGEHRLRYLRPAGIWYVHRLARHGVSHWGMKAWSPDSRYLAFVERTETGDRVKCFPKDMDLAPFRPDQWGAYVLDLPVPQECAIWHLHWSPDSTKLLATAHVQTPGKEGEIHTSDPRIFLTGPSAEVPDIVWHDEQLQDRVPWPRWADGGKLIVFALKHCGYDPRGRLLAIRPDGTGLRVLWRKPEVTHFELSPDGRRALLWLLQSWRDGAPEPDRMAAVNVLTGATKLYEDEMVALEPNCTFSWSGGRVTQSIKWADDGNSVSLIVRTRPHLRDYHRATLDLP